MTDQDRWLNGGRPSRELLELLLDAAVDMSIAITAEGRYVYANRAMLNGIGRRLDEIVGKRIEEVFSGDEAEWRRSLLDEVLRTRADVTRENRVRCEDGEHVFEVTLRPVFDAAGELVCALGSRRDITARVRNEQRLLEYQHALQSSQRVARLGSWVWHIQRNRLDWSDEMFRIFGIDRASFSGDLAAVVAAAIHPDDRPAVERSNRLVATEGRPTPLSYRVVRPDGSVRVVWAEAGELLRDADGRPSMLTGIVQDITERTQAEEAKARLEARLLQSQKMESVGRLAGGIAHDFNNMLSVILGHTDLALAAVEPTTPVAEDLTEIRTAARRSAELTRQLLAFARKQPIAPKPLDLNVAIAGLLKMLQRLMGENVSIEWTPHADLWSVLADPSQIDQVLANLCVNARDAIEGTGHVRIRTRNVSVDAARTQALGGLHPGDYVELTVSDDGRGMDPEVVAHIFEPFFTTKDSSKGTGLGLATVYGIVQQNRGSIDVASFPAQGTTFTIHWPRHASDEHEHKAPGSTHPSRGGHETILVTEDESSMLLLAKRMLERLGYTILLAASPSEALHLANSHPGAIDLLLSDVVLPQMNGHELARRMLAIRPGLRVVFMSGYTSDVIARQGILESGVNLLSKPFTPSELAHKVREALDAPRSE